MSDIFADQTTQEGATPDPTANIPSYMLAADNHNIGNGNFSFFDPSSWADKANNAAKFAVSAAVSGATSIANTGVAAVNWLAADNKVTPFDNNSILSGIDSDLGQYYQQNKESADLVGFVASSFAPGIGGIKVLNAGQKMLSVAREGWVGTNIARATGLLVPDVEKATVEAATQLAQSSAQTSLISSQSISALAKGFGQAALESAAFETSVAVTMNKSPILEDQDVSDLVKNAAMGTLVGGAIGGVISGAINFAAIRATRNVTDQVFAPVTHINELQAAASPADRITSYVQDLQDLGAVTSMDKDAFVNNYLSKIPNLDGSAGSTDAMWSKFQSMAATKENKLNNLVRTEFQKLVPGKDAELANFVTDNLQGLPASTLQANLTHLQDIGRMTDTLGTEKEIAGIFKSLAAKNSNAMQVAEDTGAAQLAKKVGYVKLTGEDAGNLSFDAPKVLGIGDTSNSVADALKTVSSFAKNSKWATDGKGTWSALDATHQEAEMRYLWADRIAKPLQEGATIGQHDIPLLEKAFQQKLANVTIRSADGTEYNVSNANLYNEIKQSKLETANQLLQGKKAGTGIESEEIAKVVNVKKSYLEGSADNVEANDLFARQTAKDNYRDSLQQKGLNPDLANDMDLKPTYLKAGYNLQPLTGMDGTVLEGMAHVKAQQKIYQQGIDAVVAKNTGDLYDRLWHPSQDVIAKLDRSGASPGLFSFASGIYHSAASWAESIGQATAAIEKKFIADSHDSLDSVAYKLSQNPTAAIEFQSINNKLAATTEKYILKEDGTGLISRSVAKYQEDVKNGIKSDYPKLQEGADVEIPFNSPEATEAWISHIRLNGQRVMANQEIHAAQGLEDAKDPATAYPMKPNPKDYNHFAFVRDPSVTGVGHMSMIHAPDADTLEKLIERVPSNLDVIRKGESEEWHRATADYSLDRTLHENYIDSTLKNSGVNSQFFMQTNPSKISEDFLNWHLNQDRTLAKTLVSAKFDSEFAQIRRTAEQYGLSSSSRYGDAYADIKDITKNPFMSYIKTALNINQSGDYPLLRGLNTILDGKVSQAANLISDLFAKTTKPADLDAVNSALDKFGMKSAYYDSAMNTLVNKGPNSGVLRDFISKSNALLSALTIRLNPINAINNVVGSVVLLGPETRVLSRMAASDPNVMARLQEVTKTGLPGTSDSILSSSKLISSAIKNFWKDMGEGKGAVSAEYTRMGWMPHGITDEIRQMVEDGTISGNEAVPNLSDRLGRMYASAKVLMQKTEVYSGNRLGEQFNRFVAADVAKQISDVMVDAGAIGRGEQSGIINSFVNRVHGNLLASQRPMLFQGPVGQAISLFQTYQFNMVQQLLRMVGEGSAKDAAMAVGLQGTVYGMSGLPAFNYINQHIVGTMSGNPQHRDLYDAVYGTAGKGLGDWLMYGLPSNLLQTNIYAHGDMNPRHVTLIPTNPADIPLFSAYGKFFGALKDTTSKVMSGGNVWESTLQGIEHAGIIKPLAGLAQTLQATTNDQRQAFSTDSKGNILTSNDLMSIATVSRLAGGVPFDEAIMKDATYRYSAYQAVDKQATDNLSEALKTQLIGGQQPDPASVNSIAERYAGIGGTQKNFNKFMMSNIVSANMTQANRIMEHLKNPYAQTMQQIMGGSEVPDGRRLTSSSSYTSSTNTQ